MVDLMGLNKLPGSTMGVLRVIAGVLIIGTLAIVGSTIGCVKDVSSQQPVQQGQAEYYPSPDDNRSNGLDPIEQLRMRDRIRIMNLERRLANMERLARVQIRQIDQLQRFTFGIGIGRTGQQRPPGLIGSAGPDKEAVQPIETPTGLLPKDDQPSDGGSE